MSWKKQSSRIFSIILFFLSINITAEEKTILSVELATTSYEKEWGLMGRTSLPENSGMLFIYHSAQKLNFWMFNTFIDLSVAYIDSNYTIREIYFMKAYPEKMDPNRPIKKLSDIDKYWYWGAEKTFFRDHSTPSKGEYPYALEVNAGWFDRHHVKIGDKIELDTKNKLIIFTRDTDPSN